MSDPENIDDIIALLKQKGFVTKEHLEVMLMKPEEPDAYDMPKYKCGKCNMIMSQREVDEINFRDAGCPGCNATGNVLIEITVESTE